jgi:hypothetical protein
LEYPTGNALFFAPPASSRQTKKAACGVWCDPARLPITAFLALTAIQEEHANRRSRFLQLVAFRFAVEILSKTNATQDGDATRDDEKSK